MSTAELKLNGTTIISESGGTATIQNAALDAGVIFPAGHVLQIQSGVYNFTADVGISTTSEAFGPVVPMNMVNANAKVFIIYSMGESYALNVGGYFRAVYKTTSFTAAHGNTSHGASPVITPSSFKFRYNSQTSTTVHQIGTISNIAGQTIYFAAEGIVWGGGTFYPNYGGGNSNMIFTVMEIQQ